MTEGTNAWSLRGGFCAFCCCCGSHIEARGSHAAFMRTPRVGRQLRSPRGARPWRSPVSLDKRNLSYPLRYFGVILIVDKFRDFLFGAGQCQKHSFPALRGIRHRMFESFD